MTLEYFMSRVIKRDSGCLEWSGCLRGKSGYGAVRHGGKTLDAHRLSWILNNGTIPDGLFVLHTCDNRICVNLLHLRLGTPKDNYDDAVLKGRIIPGRPPSYSPPHKHPSISAYKRRRCRCDDCVILYKTSLRAYRIKVKLRRSDTSLSCSTSSSSSPTPPPSPGAARLPVSGIRVALGGVLPPG